MTTIYSSLTSTNQQPDTDFHGIK